MNESSKRSKSPHATFKDRADDEVALQILEIIEKSPHITQQAIKFQTGLATGLVHSYMRKIINKGWVKANQVTAKRWLYYLTPEGFIEKSRLTIEYFSLTFQNYRQAQQAVQALLDDIVANRWRALVVVGDNDLAEITALNIKARDELELVGMANDNGARSIAGANIIHWENVLELDCDRILVCDADFLEWWRSKGKEIDDRILIHLVGSSSIRPYQKINT